MGHWQQTFRFDMKSTSPELPRPQSMQICHLPVFCGVGKVTQNQPGHWHWGDHKVQAASHGDRRALARAHCQAPAADSKGWAAFILFLTRFLVENSVRRGPAAVAGGHVTPAAPRLGPRCCDAVTRDPRAGTRRRSPLCGPG
jgi:hypothetical protein